MDGKLLVRTVLDSLDLPVHDELTADLRMIYYYLDSAVVEFVRETRCLTTTTTITTVASQQTYDLPPDFIALYLKNNNDRFIVKYYDGSQYWWPTKVSYDAIFYDNETEAQDTPDVFAITDANDPGSVTGSATSDGAQTGGECTLTDSTKQFTSTDLVYARDIVHNITDDSDGIVLEVVSDTELKTALFDGKSNQWSSGDEYRIERSGHKQITFDAPCSTAGHIVTVPYVCMPQPVFSSYRNWRFPASTCRAVCMEAAYLYASQKEDFAMADRLRAAFAEEVRRYRIETARSTLQGGRYSDIGIYRTRL